MVCKKLGRQRGGTTVCYLHIVPWRAFPPPMGIKQKDCLSGEPTMNLRDLANQLIDYEMIFDKEGPASKRTCYFPVDATEEEMAEYVAEFLFLYDNWSTPDEWQEVETIKEWAEEVEDLIDFLDQHCPGHEDIEFN
jgi:hypothetical protein